MESDGASEEEAPREGGRVIHYAPEGSISPALQPPSWQGKLGRGVKCRDQAREKGLETGYG